mmetsp:Transcript_36466/g.112807  ORF Transcript_36466/g.112807 Transcript_36466/m.112807 type:complete len:231 (+) Transcript_36466:344-1036(+)
MAVASRNETDCAQRTTACGASPRRAYANSSSSIRSWKRSAFAYQSGPSTRTTSASRAPSAGSEMSDGEDRQAASASFAGLRRTVKFGVATVCKTRSSETATATATPLRAPHAVVTAKATNHTSKSLPAPSFRRSQSSATASASTSLSAETVMTEESAQRGTRSTRSAAGPPTTAATTHATTTFEPMTVLTPSERDRADRESPICTGTPPTAAEATLAAPRAQSSRAATTW